MNKHTPEFYERQARLIAYAPAMEDALEHADRLIAEVLEHRAPHMPPAALQCVIRDLLAKVRGEVK